MAHISPRAADGDETLAVADAEQGGAVLRLRDRAEADPAERFGDLIGHIVDKPSRTYAQGDALPALTHWLLFQPRGRHEERGPDGHAARGGFLPDLEGLPRRMWAGSDVTFHAPILADDRLVQHSRIESVDLKSGRSGRLGFVVVLHEVRTEDGRCLIEDRQTLVYRPAPRAGAPARPQAVAPSSDTEELAVLRTRTFTPDPVLLFRYSALTYNGHRIHYDRPYARDVEGYPDLVVHGPLIATLLLELSCKGAGAPTRFSFRALSPAFVNRPITLRTWKSAQSANDVEAWAYDETGTPAFRSLTQMDSAAGVAS